MSWCEVHRQTAVAAYFSSKQLLLFAFAWHCVALCSPTPPNIKYNPRHRVNHRPSRLCEKYHRLKVYLMFRQLTALAQYSTQSDHAFYVGGLLMDFSESFQAAVIIYMSLEWIIPLQFTNM